MFSLTIQRRVTNSALSFVSNQTHSGDVQTVVDETIADATVDKELLIAIDVSQLQVVAMMSTVDMTIKTNSSGAPQETFNLVANKPVIFEVGDTSIFAGDVSSVYVSNSSGLSGEFKLNAVMQN